MKIENNRQNAGIKMHSKEKKYTGKGTRMMNKGKGEEAAAHKHC